MTPTSLRSAHGRLAAGLAVAIAAAAHAQPPDTRRVDHVDTLHGVEVADPYRWLEDTDAPDVGDWVARQNAHARAHLDALPGRDALRERLTALWDYERQGLPALSAGGAMAFERNSGLQEQPVILFRAAPDAEPTVLLDPNAMKADEPISVSDFALSPDGRILAYALSRSGSDWNRIRFRRTDTGADLDETITRVKFSGIAWTADSSGIFYSRYPDAPAEARDDFDPLAGQTLRFHRLGTPPADDPVVRAAEDHPRRGFGAGTSEDGRWLYLYDWEGTRYNQLHVQRLDDADTDAAGAGEPIAIATGFDADYSVVGSRGDTIFVRTNRDAPRGRIVAVDADRPQPAHWRTVVAESGDVLRDARIVDGRIVVHALRDAASVLRVFATDGEPLRDIALPELGTVTGIRGRADGDALYYGFTSASRPTAQYRIDLADADSEPASLHAPKIAFDPDAYVTRRGFATSRDGTRIPVLVTHRRDLDRDGTNPTVLYGYGGFDIPLTPGFRISAAAWMQTGGVWAVANARGGGEYGSQWHDAGIRDNKSNTFDDMIAVAGWLIHNGYTAPAHLALHGTSNGGMMVGAVINRRPDLFAAAVPAVGVMDMLRFHRFTIGWAWTSDYGDPENAEDFKTLRGYSPYHNIAPGTEYPATLVTTADHDDRVAPAHSYKYAARLQRAQGGEAPILLRVQTQSGHGAGKGTSTRILEWTDILAFLAAHTGLIPAAGA